MRTKLEDDGFGASAALQKREGDDVSVESAGFAGAGSRSLGSQPEAYLSLSSGSSSPVCI